jgi:RsiW-degrading membrane proteinase PrsW (M82 family)
MINMFMTKVKKFLAFLLVASILACGSYLTVYKASFLPNGYDIEAVQKNHTSLKSFNLLGIEKDIITISFSGKETWKIAEIKNQVNRQKQTFWLLYSFVTISLFLLVYKVRNGLELWKAILESTIIFGVLLPLVPLINTLHYIRDLVS